MNRPQNTNKVWIATIGGGAPKNILTETDAMGGNKWSGDLAEE